MWNRVLDLMQLLNTISVGVPHITRRSDLLKRLLVHEWVNKTSRRLGSQVWERWALDVGDLSDFGTTVVRYVEWRHHRSNLLIVAPHGYSRTRTLDGAWRRVWWLLPSHLPFDKFVPYKLDSEIIFLEWIVVKAAKTLTMAKATRCTCECLAEYSSGAWKVQLDLLDHIKMAIVLCKNILWEI